MQSLEDLATNITSTLSDMPRSGTSQTLDDIIGKIVDLQSDVKVEVDKLIAIKRNIQDSINALPCAKHRDILEMRYLSDMEWQDIADELHYDVRHLYRLHDEALLKLCH